MKPNRFQQTLAAGKTPVGHMLMEFGTRGMAQMLESADIDFVLIDTEHSPFGVAEIANLVAWFKATTIAPFVRIPQIEYHFIARTLDMGALGIMIPNVKTGEAARRIVNAAKYAPLGDRGVALGTAHTDYKSVVPAEFMAYANQNTTIICQIESQEGLDNLEEIASTPGVDVLWVGHFDLTQSMGIPGQFDNQRFLDGLQKVVDVARQRGLGAGIQPGSLAQAQQWMEIGYNVISYAADIAVYGAALNQAVSGVRKLAGERE
ncbi:MAG: aldolase/citrate lyase family protein [Caldilineaceae bacterium]